MKCSCVNSLKECGYFVCLLEKSTSVPGASSSRLPRIWQHIVFIQCWFWRASSFVVLFLLFFDLFFLFICSYFALQLFIYFRFCDFCFCTVSSSSSRMEFDYLSFLQQLVLLFCRSTILNLLFVFPFPWDIFENNFSIFIF